MELPIQFGQCKPGFKILGSSDSWCLTEITLSQREGKEKEGTEGEGKEGKLDE
jgi:hypothetical protein